MKDRLGKTMSDPSRHHTIRLGDGGHDIPENIMIVEQAKHDLIHCTLDMGGKCHSRAIRSYNKMVNGKHVVPPDAYDILHGIQTRYFENVYKLPDDLIKMHKLVMIDLVKVMEGKRKKLTGRKRVDDRSTFHEGHTVYMNIEKQVARKLHDMFKKHYNL